MIKKELSIGIKTKTITFSIISTKVDVCSGHCRYCTPASCMSYKQLNMNNMDNIEKMLREVDKINYKKWERDWEAVYKTIKYDPRFNEDVYNNIHFDLWGADPVTNLLIMKETVAKLKEIASRLNCTATFSSSTNGLPLIRNDIYNFIVENRISIQLSHDGVGQYIRTNDIDPLDFDNTKDLIRLGLLKCINATLNGQNPDLFENMNFFYQKLYKNEYTRSRYKGLYIKLNHISETPNVTEFTLTGRSLDTFMHGWQIVARRLSNGSLNGAEFTPFIHYFITETKRYGKLKNFYSSANNCRDFQIGVKDYSHHIDTIGKYSQCNLIDSYTNVANKSNNLPDICKDCKYKLSSECNICGQMGHRTDRCEFNYRWNLFQEECYIDRVSRRKNVTRKSQH